VMLAAGFWHSAAVTSDGAVWTWGDCVGRGTCLGHGEKKIQPAALVIQCMRGNVMHRVFPGWRPPEPSVPHWHFALPPTRLGKAAFGGSAAVLVACGKHHTMVVTVDGELWTFGAGRNGQLGHGDNEDKSIPTRVGAFRFGGAKIVMVAAGGEDQHGHYSVAASADGDVFTWGFGRQGQLGHNDAENKLVPTKIDRELLGGSKVVVVAAGGKHSVVVTKEGELFSWGCDYLGDDTNKLLPKRVGSEEGHGCFGGSRVFLAACGDEHTLAVTEAGTLWSWGSGEYGALGLGLGEHRFCNEYIDRPTEEEREGFMEEEEEYWEEDEGFQMIYIPKCVDTQHFGGAKIVTIAAGTSLSMAVTEGGTLFTWGKGFDPWEYSKPTGLGHANIEHKHVPTRVTELGQMETIYHPKTANPGIQKEPMLEVVPGSRAMFVRQEARVGRCHSLPPDHALAFAMGTHYRLARGVGLLRIEEDEDEEEQTMVATDEGRGCSHVSKLDGDLVKLVVDWCRGWPEGGAGELEGVVRLMGGGLMRGKTLFQT
jgi:alpha-tubulin suppressor-like RCC1 family protein